MPTKAEVRARMRQEERRKKNMPIIFIIIAALVVLGLLIVPNLLPKTIGSRPMANGLSMGNENALVKVEEFADFQCPACALFFSDIEPKIVKDYVATGKISYRFVPFSFVGPESVTAAEAAYCANDQGKFWEFHDMLYSDQHGENSGWFTNTRMISYAKDLKLNVDSFTECLTSEKYKLQIQDNLDYGKTKSIDRTPSFLVNGRLVYSDTVLAVIDSTLKSTSGK